MDRKTHLVFDLEIWHGIDEVDLTSNDTNFTSKLFDLIAKADIENTQKLRIVYPDEVKTYELFKRHGPELFNMIKNNPEKIDWDGYAEE